MLSAFIELAVLKVRHRHEPQAAAAVVIEHEPRI